MNNNDEYDGARKHYLEFIEKKKKMYDHLPEDLRKRMRDNIDKYYEKRQKEFFDGLKKRFEEKKKKGQTKEDIELLNKQLELMKEHYGFAKEIENNMTKYIEELRNKRLQSSNK